MPENAESHSVQLPTNRTCTIEITNVSANYCLVNPKVHMDMGFSYSPPQPTVRTTKTEVCSFIKDDNTATGTAGVLTYEMFHMRNRTCVKMMAIMFSVPFDYTYYKNYLGIGFFDKKREGKDLFKYMYNNKEFPDFIRQEANGSGLKYCPDSEAVEVRGCMCDDNKGIVKIELYDSMRN
ncbi:tereporin-Ca1-like [Platichthys flesus]|uniref:tereporin-Ca1-like n=1 Tax=Platichthys flesus TaxID=8260 RepID=UPI001A89C934|nr:tereporin-Ca1-like [Platichthys flesus]XP_062269859.1 tereporin-Ca1-like [Platichthys flesus]